MYRHYHSRTCIHGSVLAVIRGDRAIGMQEPARKSAFPEDFQWGVATSAFQLEGSPNADWSTWDPVLSDIPEITNHYAVFREDLKLLKELGVNSYRFSIEWSRIQPRPDTWDDEAIAHYQEIIDILRSYNIEPMVTLHHFTHPRWFLERFPWHRTASVENSCDTRRRWSQRSGTYATG